MRRSCVGKHGACRLELYHGAHLARTRHGLQLKQPGTELPVLRFHHGLEPVKVNGETGQHGLLYLALRIVGARLGPLTDKGRPASQKVAHALLACFLDFSILHLIVVQLFSQA